MPQNYLSPAWGQGAHTSASHWLRTALGKIIPNSLLTSGQVGFDSPTITRQELVFQIVKVSRSYGHSLWKPVGENPSL